nr:HAD-IA family hydrolase [uncultured Cohaesibacter sp.]
MTHQIPFHGCLFDLDGTLIDSSSVVNRAWGTLLTRHGLDPEHYLPLIHGRPAHESIREFLQFVGEDVIRQEIKRLHDKESTDTRGVVPLEGAIDFLQRLSIMQVPWTIVTSGTVAIACARIKAAGIPMPTQLVTADDISHGKPHPEPYLKGASKLGIAPQDCLVFEDAAAGIASGIAAGSHVIGVAATPTSSGQESIPSILSYSQLTVSRLATQADGKDFLITID